MVLPEDSSHKVNGSYPFIHYHVGINLCSVEAGMTKHLTGHATVGFCGQGNRGECRADAMERDCLINAGMVCYC